MCKDLQLCTHMYGKKIVFGVHLDCMKILDGDECGGFGRFSHFLILYVIDFIFVMNPIS